MYKNVIKRLLDIILSVMALIVLALPLIFVALLIKIDDPGPALFFQKRVGKKENGEITYFQLAKFRTMKMSTPHDVPTHQLENPQQYITKVGKFLRKTSLDELPQLLNILSGKMSFIGPRPALWNQYDLIEEREKYSANDILPGLTGWAQINGRDELEIPVKAKLDGDYAAKLSFAMDVKCFFGTITAVLKKEGVVEGGTGELNRNKTDEK
ncbi:MAG: sugar transferase [Eubacteriaceae bacterium]|nr:sugar transferase [Eubacteriaceae bacterium]